MQRNNPFRIQENVNPPAPLADQYYAAPPTRTNPPSDSAPARSPEVDSLARVFDQGLSLQNDPVREPIPQPYHDPSAHDLTPLSSLPPPPTYSERSPSAPPQTQAPAFPVSPPAMPEVYYASASASAGEPLSRAYPSSEGEKRRLRERDREIHYETAHDSGLPSTSTASSSRSEPSLSRGPSQAPSNSMFNKVLNRANPRNPLDPPPPSFSRTVAPHIVQGIAPQFPGYPPQGLAPFAPMTLFAKEKYLEGGFPLVPPPCAMQPHPFSHRDVVETDWVRFLEDLQIAGRLTGGQKAVAGVLPVTMHLGLPGLIVSKALKMGMKRKTGPVAELVDTWNHHFFRSRRLHVILARGTENLSGDVDGPAPDWVGLSRSQDRSHSRRSRSSSCSTCSSSSSDDGHRRRDRHTIREERRYRRAERRAEHRERREHRRAERRARRESRREGRRHGGKADKLEKRYRLVVVSI